MIDRIQAGRIYVVDLSGHRIPVRALKPLSERRGWWMAESCRSQRLVRVSAAAFEAELEEPAPAHVTADSLLYPCPAS